MDSELPLHRVGAHLLPSQTFGVVVHIVEVWVESAVGSDRPRELRVEVLLIRGTPAKALLAQHFAECELVVVCVHAHKIAGLRVACFHLRVGLM